MTTSTTERPVAAAGASRRDPRRVLRQSLAMFRRNMMQLRADPLDLLAGAMMPMLLALIFLYVFGGAISNGNIAGYRLYLLPGIMVDAITFASRSTGVGLNMDFSNGMVDRFRSFPIARSSILIGRITADVMRMALGQIVMLTFALLVGFRAAGGVGSILAASLVMLAFGAALSCVSAFIGLAVRSPQAVQSLGFMWMIPLQFASSMFVQPSTMPSWLRGFAEINPVSLVCDASRDLMMGVDATGPLLGTLAWIVGIVAVFGPLAVLQYSRRL
jgi:oleandomycin transport system permease protein